MQPAHRLVVAGLALVAGAAATHAQEISQKDRYGQVMRVALPMAAVAYSIYKADDVEGVTQLVMSTALSAGSTELLKRGIHAKRPDRRDDDSFPSGHTAVTFAAAAYIHKRYSFMEALPFYGLAALTGYKRVHTHNHFTRDVIGGAAVGIVSAWLVTGHFTTPRSTASIGYWDKTLVVNYATTW